MNPQMLIDPTTTSGVPAPIWFVEFFKVLGFALHAVPMNLWYAGIICALVLYWRRNEHSRRFSVRLMKQMPVVVAVGINLGIVPLLFLQLAYYRVFYPATILMAWHWLSIIILLIPAYYGVYYYAGGLRDGGTGLTASRKLAGWGAALLFIAIGFLFANGLSLMTRVAAWPELWMANHTGAATWGVANNTTDPTLWPRWLMMFGLALTTTAAWVYFDQAWFAGRESADYRRWAARFAPRLYTFGMIWFAATGSWYVFGTWSKDLQETMFGSPWLVLTAMTAMAPGLPWLLLLASRNKAGYRGIGLLVAVAQFGVLGINAVSRQVVQNLELSPYFDALAQATNVQWSPLVLFLILFVAGLGVIIWMIAKVVQEVSQPQTEQSRP